MKKILFIAAVLLTGTFSTSLIAQDSKSILDELSTKSRSYTSVYAEYEATLIDEKNGINQSQSGKIKIKGEKYNLDIANYNIICDGVNLWSYDTETNYCAIELLEDMDSDLFDPAKIFTIWENDFKHEYKNTITENGNTLYHINLYPINPDDKPFHTIQLYIDKTKMEVVRIVSKGRDGADTEYVVKKFSANMEYEDSDFTFDPMDYPGVDVEDNRM